jgi:hypothetical protein
LLLQDTFRRDEKYVDTFYREILKGSDNLKSLAVDGMMLRKWILKKLDKRRFDVAQFTYSWPSLVNRK